MEINNDAYSEQFYLEIINEQQPYLLINKIYTYTVRLIQNNEMVKRPWVVDVRPYMANNEDTSSYIEFLPTTNILSLENGEVSFQFKLLQATKLTLSEAMTNDPKKMCFYITAFENDQPILQHSSLPFVAVRYKLVVKCLQTADSYLLFFKDRGGKESGIELSITLENEQGNMVINKIIDLQASLLYENGFKVMDQSLLVTTTSSHSGNGGGGGNNAMTREDFQLKNGYKQLKFRIHQVSSKHCNQRFVIQIAAPLISPVDGQLLSEWYEIAPANSIPIEVRSKVNKRKPSITTTTTATGITGVASGITTGANGIVSATANTISNSNMMSLSSFYHPHHDGIHSNSTTNGSTLPVLPSLLHPPLPSLPSLAVSTIPTSSSAYLLGGTTTNNTNNNTTNSTNNVVFPYNNHSHNNTNTNTINTSTNTMITAPSSSSSSKEIEEEEEEEDIDLPVEKRPRYHHEGYGPLNLLTEAAAFTAQANAMNTMNTMSISQISPPPVPVKEDEEALVLLQTITQELQQSVGKPHQQTHHHKHHH